MVARNLAGARERADFYSQGGKPDAAPFSRKIESTHDSHDIMTKVNFSTNNDNNDLYFTGNIYTIRDHESHAPAKIETRWRKTDTQVPARYLMVLVNSDETYRQAQEVLGLYPQKLFMLTQHAVRQAGDYQAGVVRVQEVIDFVVSLLTEVPYFQCTQDGRYDPHPAAQKTRARNMLIDLVMSGKPLLAQYAGPRYRRRWSVV